MSSSRVQSAASWPKDDEKARWPGLPQYTLENGKYVSKNGDYWIQRAENYAKCNKFAQWAPAYTKYCLERGGEATKAYLNNTMGTSALVAALVASFVIQDLANPPACTDNDLQRCVIDPDMMTTFGAIGGVASLSCLTTIVIVTIATMWLNIAQEQEMCWFLEHNYLACVMFPVTTMSLAVVCTQAMVLIRLWAAYDIVASIVTFIIAGIFAVSISYTATRMVLQGLKLREISGKTDNVDRATDDEEELVDKIVSALDRHANKMAERKL